MPRAPTGVAQPVSGAFGRSLMIIVQDHCPRSLSKTRQQGSNARLRPALDDQGSGPRIDVDPVAWAKNDLVGTGGPSHRHLASQDENRRPCFLDVDRPFRAAHGGDGLWRRDLKAIFAPLFGSVDQQGLALKIDGIDTAILVAILQRELGAVLGDDGHAATAAQGLYRVRRMLR